MTSLNGGGAERIAAGFANGLKTGECWDFVALKKGNGKARRWFKREREPTLLSDHYSFVSVLLFIFASFFRRNSLIITSLPAANIIGLILKFLNLNSRLIVWCHNEKLNRVDVFILKYFKGFINTILCDSSVVKSNLIKEVPGCAEMIRVPVPNQIMDIRESEFSLNNKHTTTKLVSFGRLEKQKNYTFFNYAENSSGYQFQVDIYGAGIQEQKLRRIKNINLRGFVADIHAINFSEYQFYVQCSIHEGLCISILEAIAAGLPVLTTKVGEAQHYLAGCDCFFDTANHASFERLLINKSSIRTRRKLWLQQKKSILDYFTGSSLEEIIEQYHEE